MQNWKRWVGMGIGALALAGGTLALTSHNLTAQADENTQEGGPRPQIRQPGEPPAFQGGGQPGQPGFGGPPGGGFGGPPGGGRGFGGFGGGSQLTATPTGVYVLRGNTLYAYDPRTLKLAAKADLPDDGPRFGPQGGPGQPGQPPRPGQPGTGRGGGQERF